MLRRAQGSWSCQMAGACVVRESHGLAADILHSEQPGPHAGELSCNNNICQLWARPQNVANEWLGVLFCCVLPLASMLSPVCLLCHIHIAWQGLGVQKYIIVIFLCWSDKIEVQH